MVLIPHTSITEFEFESHGTKSKHDICAALSWHPTLGVAESRQATTATICEPALEQVVSYILSAFRHQYEDFIVETIYIIFASSSLEIFYQTNFLL